MNLLKDEAHALIAEILGMLEDEVSSEKKVILFPSFVHLGAAIQLCSVDKRISIGAQNCSDKASGALTGEVSAGMLRSIGCKYVLVGHSERRQFFGENNALLACKINSALKELVHPVYCIGETLDQRNSGNHFSTVASQLQEGIFHLVENDFRKCIIAYEPVWAIGTGVTARTDQAQEMHAYIRSLISNKYGNAVAQDTTILYGGSCNDQNAAELFAQADVDGGLIGGAALKSRSFVNIIKALN